MKVLYIGHYKESSGWGKAARDYILAMDSVGIDVVPRAFKLNESKPEVPARILELEQKSVEGCTHCIQHVLPHHLDFNGRFKKNIALCVYESFCDELSSWSAKINTMDELWTSSQFSEGTFTTSNVTVPIKIVPHTFDMSVYNKTYEKMTNPELDGNFIFYTIADLNKRKDLFSLIQAFHLAFSPNEPVRLLIKTSKHGMSPENTAKVVMDECAKIKQSMKLYRRIEDYSSEIIVTHDLSNEDIMKIHATCDCFVTTSHGEAWCIPLFDAMAMGKMAVYPENVFDFARVETGTMKFEVPTYITPVFGMTDSFFELGSSRENWNQIDIVSLVKNLRDAYESRDIVCDKTSDIQSLYNYDTIGNKIKGLLNE